MKQLIGQKIQTLTLIQMINEAGAESQPIQASFLFGLSPVLLFSPLVSRTMPTIGRLLFIMLKC